MTSGSRRNSFARRQHSERRVRNLARQRRKGTPSCRCKRNHHNLCPVARVASCTQYYEGDDGCAAFAPKLGDISIPFAESPASSLTLSKILFTIIRRHFGASHFLFERALCFLRSRAFWFCLVQVSTILFCSFPPILMARVSDGTDVPVSPLPATSSNIGSPDGSLPDLEETGIRASTMEEKSTTCSNNSRRCHYSCKVCPGSKNVSRRSPGRWPLVLQKLQMLNKLLAASQSELLHLKLFQPPTPSLFVCANSKQVQPLASAAPTRHALGIYFDIVMAPHALGPTGPMARGLLTTTGTQDVGLIPFPEDEHARSAVLLRFPCEQHHAGLSTWFEKFWATTNASFSKSTRIHCKTGSL